MADLQYMIRPAIAAATPMASQAVGTAVTAATGSPLIGQAAATATPMVIDAATNYVLGDKGNQNQMPQQIIPSQNQIRSSMGMAPVYDTNQANQSLMANSAAGNMANRQIMQQGSSDLGQRMDDYGNREAQTLNTYANIGNAGANANLARQMALNNQNTINAQYQAAGDRLNQAANSTQANLNQAASIVAGMFR